MGWLKKWTCSAQTCLLLLIIQMIFSWSTVSTSALCPNINITSGTVPTNVHNLKMGDIKIVAGMGDSLTAGNGAKATNVFDVMKQYRGRSFSAGGDGSYTQGITTFPNILRLFNPDVYGYSVGDGSSNGQGSRLNVATAGALARNMPSQAARLVHRLTKDANVNMTHDWKIVTLFVGGNDLCEYCTNTSLHSVANHKADIRRALDILHNYLPRTLVNVVEVFDINFVTRLYSRNFLCRLIIGNICPCAKTSNRQALTSLASGYQQAVRDLVSSGRYDTRDDFTVIVQPFLRQFTLPTTQRGSLDFSYFAPDCFHLSTKGQNAAGRALWNTMLQSTLTKPTNLDFKAPVNCPTMDFIPTRFN